MLERAAGALLDYIESDPDGFRILVRDPRRDSPPGRSRACIGDVASQVEHLLAAEFSARLDPKSPRLRADARRHGRADRPVVARLAQVKKAEVAAHLVNLAWNGLKRPRAEAAAQFAGAA